jgi:GTP-binding protein
LIHPIDASQIDENVRWGMESRNRELELFDPDLGRKPQIVVANKIDLPEGRSKAELLAKKLPKGDRPLKFISAATTEGVRALVQYVGMKLEEIKQRSEVSRDAAGI